MLSLANPLSRSIMENIGRCIKQENSDKSLREIDCKYEALLKNILHKNNQEARTPKHETFDNYEEPQKKSDLSRSIPIKNMMSLVELSKNQRNEG